ncbi:hypothetical protein Q9L42_008780 [Methylomarinum sp. Ch1-1]|uniref:Uncharacterized protein n=1 Tax=Methylomarinum roseum TaxID=3067653 RepID=A0AAU7NZ42_9GAMM|nr:hypothetical protein [Methylomarinum sp. Ch1-1]MDP4521674.1 hypothetical protein [Methylomarinum sp. Ch1-1]
MNQKTNDQIILAQIIEEKCAESEAELTVAEYFEIYSASEILKDHDLTYDDISYGIEGKRGQKGKGDRFIFWHLNDKGIFLSETHSRIIDDPAAYP